MQPIADWLEKLGLSEYAQPFADNDIDFTILRDLTDQDLEKIGIASLGHRRKILRAIRNLEPIETRPPACAVEAPAVPLPLESAERRQVTVMFCDLVGSTALSARMDPEDLREVIAAYHRCAAEIVRRFGGFVAQYLGDGVLVYFGYPQAHEDDAERAVRAGLELIGELGELRTHAPLQARVGIATGLVVVGDLMDSGSAMERGIVGETPNLAARLQGIAEPDALVIAEGTRKLLGNLFELVDLGARDLKGIAGPVRAWAVMRASSIESRFDALHGADLTALVGRGEESELLLRRWTRAKNGEGQVVLLSGEAGIGKSRLTAALLERLAGEPHTRLRYFCSPQHSDSALYPIIRQMEGAAGLAHDDSPQARLDKLDALLAQTSTSAEDSALFAEMLSLANDGRYPVVELTPQQRRQRTLEALTAQIKALTRASPVLMIFEDAHWIDPTSSGIARSGGGPDSDHARAVERDVSAGIRSALDRPALRDRPHHQSAGSARHRRHDRPPCRQQGPAGKHPARYHRARRRHSPVCGGNDQGGAGVGGRGRSATDRRCGFAPGAGGPREPASVAYGAARPARPGQGGCADRGGDRAPVLPCPAVLGGAPAGCRVGIGVGPSRCGRLAVSAGRAAGCDLPVQARPGAGHGIWHSSPQSTPGVACAYRQGARTRIPGHNRDAAGDF